MSWRSSSRFSWQPRWSPRFAAAGVENRRLAGYDACRRGLLCRVYRGAGRRCGLYPGDDGVALQTRGHRPGIVPPPHQDVLQQGAYHDPERHHHCPDRHLADHRPADPPPDFGADGVQYGRHTRYLDRNFPREKTDCAVPRGAVARAVCRGRRPGLRYAPRPGQQQYDAVWPRPDDRIPDIHRAIRPISGYWGWSGCATTTSPV